MKKLLYLFIIIFAMFNFVTLFQLSAQEIDTVKTKKAESVLGKKTVYITELNIGYYSSIVLGLRFFDSIDIIAGLGKSYEHEFSAGFRYVIPYKIFSFLKPQITAQFVYPITQYYDLKKYSNYKAGFTFDWKDFYACVDYNFVDRNKYEVSAQVKELTSNHYGNQSFSFGVGYKIGL